MRYMPSKIERGGEGMWRKMRKRDGVLSRTRSGAHYIVREGGRGGNYGGWRNEMEGG